MLEVFLWPAHSTGRERPSSPAQHCAFNIIVSHSSACLYLLCVALRHLHMPMFEGCLTADNIEAVESHQCTMAITILIEGRIAQHCKCFVTVMTIMPPKEATTQHAVSNTFSSFSAQSGAIHALADTPVDSSPSYELCVQLGRRLSVQVHCHRVL